MGLTSSHDFPSVSLRFPSFQPSPLHLKTLKIMGQRFQVLTVARIIPKGDTKPYYRCIAIHHHQRCYGELPVLAVYRVLELLKNPSTR